MPPPNDDDRLVPAIDMPQGHPLHWELEDNDEKWIALFTARFQESAEDFMTAKTKLETDSLRAVFLKYNNMLSSYDNERFALLRRYRDHGLRGYHFFGKIDTAYFSRTDAIAFDKMFQLQKKLDKTDIKAMQYALDMLPTLTEAEIFAVRCGFTPEESKGLNEHQENALREYYFGIFLTVQQTRFEQPPPLKPSLLKDACDLFSDDHPFNPRALARLTRTHKIPISDALNSMRLFTDRQAAGAYLGYSPDVLNDPDALKKKLPEEEYLRERERLLEEFALQ